MTNGGDRETEERLYRGARKGGKRDRAWRERESDHSGSWPLGPVGLCVAQADAEREAARIRGPWSRSVRPVRAGRAGGPDAGPAGAARAPRHATMRALPTARRLDVGVRSVGEGATQQQSGGVVLAARPSARPVLEAWVELHQDENLEKECFLH